MGYLSALSRADAGQFGPLATIIGRAVERGFELYLDALAATPEDAWQPLAALADATSVSAAHLGWLIRKGRLAAQKRGGRWYSTAAAVALYQGEVARGEIPRGRPPQSQRNPGVSASEQDAP